jgi:hypothetical protein
MFFEEIRREIADCIYVFQGTVNLRAFVNIVINLKIV